jgi:hypothetical protein
MTGLIRLACACVLLIAAAAAGQERDPKLPAGRDPGGIAVALFTTGLDYTHPEIATRLARDGEGELIGWDFADNDNRPFAAGPAPETARTTPSGIPRDDTALARRLLEVYARSRLVAVRIKPGDPASFAQAVAFVARTPARIVAVPFASGTRAEWEPFRQAAERFGKDLLFVLSAGDEAARAGGREVWPAAFALPNAVAVAPASPTPSPAGEGQVDVWIVPRGTSMFGPLGKDAPSPAEAVALAAGLAACAQHTAPAPDPATARAALLALGTPAEGAPGTSFDPVCLYGGRRY